MYYKFQGQDTRPDLSELLDCIKYSATSFSSTFLVLDALDECDLNQQSKVLDVIRQFRSIAVRIFATSRPHLRDVHDFFQTARTIPIRADIRDLENYLTIQVKERMSQNRMLRSKVVNTLSMRANGV